MKVACITSLVTPEKPSLMHTLDQWQTTHSIVTCLLDEQLTLHHLNNFNPMLTVSEYTTARGLCAAIRAVHAHA